jgi:hypothetical protein
MSKKRKVYPTLRPPVEDEPEPVWDEADARVIADAMPAVSQAVMDAVARAYRCPSHGRNPRATARWDNGWTIDAVCCSRAAEAIAAELDG